jgi:hypothetical protein
VVITVYFNPLTFTDSFFLRVIFHTLELSRLKTSTRRLFNKAKKTGDWEPYKMALTSYHKAIRKPKRSSWREYCRGIENVPDRARLMMIMANQSANKVGSIKLPNGCHTQAGIETLKELYRVYFPGATAGETVEIRQGQPNWGHSLQTGTGNCLKGLLTNPKLNGR